jgi:hypothetical protein
MNPPLPLFPHDTAALAARYMDTLVDWWSPAGVQAPVHRLEDPEHDAQQRWEEEGGN